MSCLHCPGGATSCRWCNPPAPARKQPSVRAVEYARTSPRVGRLLFAWVRDGELP